MSSLQLSTINIFPVKSLHGGRAEAAQVAPQGLLQDRRYMLVDGNDRFVTFREAPSLSGLRAAYDASGKLVLTNRDGAQHSVPEPAADAPQRPVKIFRDHVPARDAGDAVAAFLSAAAGREVRLVWQHDPASRPIEPAFSAAGDVVSFADGYPILLATTASLEALNAALPMAVAMGRFRPNLVVEGAQPWAEDGWRRIRVGEVTFRVVKPCVRCIMTTRDPDTGAQPIADEPLATLREIHPDQRRRPIFGQNLIPEGTGTIRQGDAVEVLELGPSNLFPAAV